MNKFENARQHRSKLEQVRKLAGPAAWSNSSVVEGDIRQPDTGAALGSVDELARSNATHVASFLNMLRAARRDRPARPGMSMNRHLLQAVNNTKFGGYRV